MLSLADVAIAFESLGGGSLLGKSLFALLVLASRADEKHSTENQSR